MGTICFVILNYKTWREAAACAESILKTQQGQDIRIVLVDNGSGNGGYHQGAPEGCTMGEGHGWRGEKSACDRK